MTEHCVVFCTCPDEISAGQLAQQLVKKQLAACVNVLPAAQSFFRWQNQMEAATEYIIMIKTTLQAYPELEAFILSQHPYKTPEMIALPIVAGSKDYLQWVTEGVARRGREK